MEKPKDAWGVGNAGCDNGLLLFLSIDDRTFYLKTAAATRKVLPDSTARVILDNMVASMSSHGGVFMKAIMHVNVCC